MPPTEPNAEERMQQVNPDEQTPFQPAEPATPASDIPVDHPATDTGIDPTELYQEGVAGAAGVEDNSGQSAVTGVTGQADSSDASTEPDQPLDENQQSIQDQAL